MSAYAFKNMVPLYIFSPDSIDRAPNFRVKKRFIWVEDVSTCSSSKLRASKHPVFAFTEATTASIIPLRLDYSRNRA
jgi:hypothetical protein